MLKFRENLILAAFQPYNLGLKAKSNIELVPNKPLNSEKNNRLLENYFFKND